MARTGKIARLPPLIFEEFNERILHNHTGPELLEWVNAQPAVKERLAQLFDGQPINDSNLSVWRAEGGGFQEWKRDRDKIAFIESIAGTTIKLAERAGNRFARNTLPVAVGAVYQALEAGQSVDFDDKGKPFVTGIGADKLGRAIASLAKVEQDDEKLTLDREKLEHDRERLALDVGKFRRDTAELFIEWCADERAKQIALGDATKDNKVAQLIQLWFGEMPENIGPAEFRKPQPKEAK